MIYVGIDVASNKHDCFIMNDNGECPRDSFTIQNNLEGYKKLHNEINSFVESSKDSNVRIGLESTGQYSNNILLYLVKAGFQVSLTNLRDYYQKKHSQGKHHNVCSGHVVKSLLGLFIVL